MEEVEIKGRYQLSLNALSALLSRDFDNGAIVEDLEKMTVGQWFYMISTLESYDHNGARVKNLGYKLCGALGDLAGNYKITVEKRNDRGYEDFKWNVLKVGRVE